MTPAPAIPEGEPSILLPALRAARAKIANVDDYIKGACACDCFGTSCSAHAPEAVRWSLDGALGRDVQTRLYLTRLLGKPVFEFEHLPKTTHGDVLVFLDSAIARQERAHAAATALT